MSLMFVLLIAAKGQSCNNRVGQLVAGDLIGNPGNPPPTSQLPKNRKIREGAVLRFLVIRHQAGNAKMIRCSRLLPK
jgi:hypothetical protein